MHAAAGYFACASAVPFVEAISGVEESRHVTPQNSSAMLSHYK
jgi:hypothetical protein